MAWPLSQEYNEAVQNLRTSLADPDLKGGEVVPGPLGIPLPRSGNFADVYQIRGADGRMCALKCFTRPAAGLRDRYLKIDAHLRAARLPFSVGFEFLPEGVRIRGLWYPALKMEWVEGQQLNTFVRENVERRENLKALLGMWLRLCKRLRDANLAHADLQHGNVLLVPGATANTLRLRLIDYDGMWVPDLADSPSGEAGHQNYQHPARLRDATYSADVDRFPHLVIGCALRALAIAGKPLWDRFDNGDNLLFREVDFANPRCSELFHALWALDDPTVTNLVALLIASAPRPIGDTPWLDEVVSGDETVPMSDAVLAYAADVLGVKRRAARQSMPVAQIYVVPREANEFVELGYSSRARRKRGLTAGIAIATAGTLFAAVTVVGIILALSNNSTPTPVDLPPPPIQPVDEGTAPTAKKGTIETNWSVVEAGPPIWGTQSLVSGIDTAPPATKIIRSFWRPGAASLGAWFLPGGTSALVASGESFSILDLHTKELRPLPRVAGERVRVLVTPNCQCAIVVSRASEIRRIDLTSGDSIWTQKFPGDIGALVITPDGKRLAATAEQVGYIEWATENGTELRRHESLQAQQLAFSVDGKWAVAASETGVELWSLDDARVTPLLADVDAGAVCITPDGRVAVGIGSTIKFWHLPDAEPLLDRTLPIKSPITRLTSTAHGALVAGSQAGEIVLIGPEQTTTIALGSATPPTAMAITADGQFGLFATDSSTLALCRVGDFTAPFGPSRLGPTAGCLQFDRSLTVSPEFVHFAADARGDRILTASESRVVVYDVAKFQPIGSLRSSGRIVSAGFGTDGDVVLCEDENDRFRTRAIELKSGDPRPSFVVDDIELQRITRITPVAERPWVLATTDPAGDILFDPMTGKVVEGWPRPSEIEPAVAAASRDGRRVAIGSADSPVRVWDCEAKTVNRRCEASTGVAALAFAPDGTQLIGLWPQGRIRIWDPVTGIIVTEVNHSHPGPFSALAAISDEIVVLTSASGRLLMSLKDGKVLSTGDGPDPLAGRGSVVPSRGWLMAVDRDERLIAWSVNPRLAAELPAKKSPPPRWPDVALVRDGPAEPVAGFAYSFEDEHLLVATKAGKLTRYSPDQLLYVNQIETDESPVYSMLRLGGKLYSLGRRANVVIRDAKSLERIAEVPATAKSRATPTLFTIHPEGSLLLVVTDKLRVIDTETKRETTIAPIPKVAVGKPLTQLAYSADGKTGVARWGDAITAVWHPKLTGNARILEEAKMPIGGTLAVSADGAIAILGTGDGRLRAWNTAAGDLLHTEDVYPDVEMGDAYSIAMHPNGKHFITAGHDGRIIIWSLNGFKKVKEIKGPEGAWRMAISADGRRLILVCQALMQRVELPEFPR